MHIMEGVLPAAHALGWALASLPAIALGLRSIRRQLRERPEARLVLGASAGFTFILSALKLPSIAGSSSHPTGIGLGALLLGPCVMSVLGLIVLLFQALLLAHGGITTLGANVFAMAIVGSYVAAGVYRIAALIRLPFAARVFAAATLSNLATYSVTALQLALAFPDTHSGTYGAALKFLGLFGISQVPLALAEGALTVLVMNLLRTHAFDVMVRLIPALRSGSR